MGRWYLVLEGLALVKCLVFLEVWHLVWLAQLGSVARRVTIEHLHSLCLLLKLSKLPCYLIIHFWGSGYKFAYLIARVRLWQIHIGCFELLAFKLLSTYRRVGIL